MHFYVRKQQSYNQYMVLDQFCTTDEIYCYDGAIKTPKWSCAWGPCAWGPCAWGPVGGNNEVSQKFIDFQLCECLITPDWFIHQSLGILWCRTTASGDLFSGGGSHRRSTFRKVLSKRSKVPIWAMRRLSQRQFQLQYFCIPLGSPLNFNTNIISTFYAASVIIQTLWTWKS